MNGVCAWDGGTEDVRMSHGEPMCRECRRVVDLDAIMHALPQDCRLCGQAIDGPSHLFKCKGIRV